MEFKENGYTVIKNTISKDLADFIYKYFLLKRKTAQTLFTSKFISPYNKSFGTWDDDQVPETYSHYADIAMETLLIELQEKMEKVTGLGLIKNYSYARIYKKGDILERHKDRYSCEISTTMHLGGDPWPIYINPNSNEGYVEGYKHPPHGIQHYVMSDSPGVKVDLEPGDMLVYRGNLFEHWREKFQGENCGQVFLHYTDKNTAGAKENENDLRLHLGLPQEFKNAKVQ